jgi:hypothetical protein
MEVDGAAEEQDAKEAIDEGVIEDTWKKRAIRTPRTHQKWSSSQKNQIQINKKSIKFEKT